MPRTRSRRKVQERLKARQVADKPPKNAPQGSRKVPGSQNPHKSFSLGRTKR